MFKISPFMLLLLMLPSLLMAESWESCRSIDADQARLACYDQYAQTLSSQQAKPTVEDQKAAFGLPKTSPADDIEAITAQITNIEKFSHGSRLIYLQNDQVWRQVGNSSQPKLRTGDMITIKRGALSSFVLKKVGSNRSMRVKRFK